MANEDDRASRKKKKRIYCWRCRAEMPLLDEEEFAEINDLYSECLRAVKDYREKHKVSLTDCVDELFSPVREEYERITGQKDVHQDEIRRHRLSSFGQPCPVCNKPFRTSEACFCAECGFKPEDDNGS